MARVGIAGGSGYGGIELIHILLGHPEAEIGWVSSEQHAGQTVEEVHPHLRGVQQLRFSSLEQLDPSGLDVLFLALPHGQAMKIVPGLPAELAVVDLSGDFRLADGQVFQQYYGFEPACPDQQKQFVYGLSELFRERIRSQRRVSNPGCFATATILALHPLFQEGWVRGPVFVDTKTGSSGAGRSPLVTTHHPRRSNSLFAYKPFTHQHLPEIEQALGRPTTPIVFQTYSAPFVRGIFASHYLQVGQRATPEAVEELYRSYYQEELFVRWVPGCPDVNSVRHSNFTDLGAAVRDGFLIVWSVLDNLQKGAAGQAVQNMNLMMGWPEQTGLERPPVHP